MLLYLPVKPYVCKFLARHWGADYQLANTDAFGRFLFQQLRAPRNDRQYESYLKRYTQKIPVRIVPYLVADRACKNFTPQTIVNFSSFVEEIFFHEFHTFVLVRVELGMQAKLAIIEFCKRHHLTEDDAPFETMKRSWQRYQSRERQRLQNTSPKPLISANSPSGLSLAA